MLSARPAGRLIGRCCLTFGRLCQESGTMAVGSPVIELIPGTMNPE